MRLHAHCARNRPEYKRNSAVILGYLFSQFINKDTKGGTPDAKLKFKERLSRFEQKESASCENLTVSDVESTYLGLEVYAVLVGELIVQRDAAVVQVVRDYVVRRLRMKVK